ncbi:hypothetical protein ACQKIC_16335 [Peribacillus sp. NPDC046944]|uniref:hypothetical protein n=1 Tax=unclassified Peribacillus TaxID=2675266 RepID=UPI003D0929E4
MIERVIVYLEYPESMEGIIRIESVTALDINGKEIKNIADLVDNQPFYSEEEVTNFISKKLLISTDGIEIY